MSEMILTPFFKEICKSYDLQIHCTDDTIVLRDSKSDACIIISQDEYFTDSTKEKAFSEYTVLFSTQHRHFNSLEEAEEYVRLILSDEVLPVEFFDSDRPRFGGEIRKDEFDVLTPESLAKRFGYAAGSLLSLEFEVHSWSGKYDIKRMKFSELYKKQ